MVAGSSRYMELQNTKGQSPCVTCKCKTQKDRLPVLMFVIFNYCFGYSISKLLLLGFIC